MEPYYERIVNDFRVQAHTHTHTKKELQGYRTEENALFPPTYLPSVINYRDVLKCSTEMNVSMTFLVTDTK